ncbi:MAG: DUF4132 domain-containing protein [Corynebacterium sp.]|nr:DUF4132 domain-containing protein [Corynebacterium sp.]
MQTDESTAPETVEEYWHDAGDYSFKLEDGVIIARNAKGRVLKTVPAKAKKLPEFEKLDGLRVFLLQHEQQCADYVRQWFLQSLPVPLSVIIAVWPDQSWRKYLHDVVVSNGQVTGFLRAADESGVHLVDLDGETTVVGYTDDATVLLQHPAVMEDLEDWREFAVELGVNQGLDQLFRDVHIKPADEDGMRAAVSAYEDGKYERYSHLMGRSRGGGFKVTMGEISVDVFEDGGVTTASLDIDAWDPSTSAELGTLEFRRNGETLKLAEVGPIAWSEGKRMCEFVYAGRTVAKEEGKN